MEKNDYNSPQVDILKADTDIITYSETDHLELPPVKADAANDQQQQ